MTFGNLAEKRRVDASTFSPVGIIWVLSFHSGSIGNPLEEVSGKGDKLFLHTTKWGRRHQRSNSSTTKPLGRSRSINTFSPWWACFYTKYDLLIFSTIPARDFSVFFIFQKSFLDVRNVFYEKLTSLGFEVVKPQGAFYMFPRSPIPDDVEFVKHAQTENILLVPGSGFGAPGYFRIAFCCEEQVIRQSFPHFEKLAHHFGMVWKEAILFDQ